MLEPYDGKLSRTVLRREGGGNTADPADYSPLVNRLKGQVIKISPNSTQFINPMDINANYSEEDNPLSLKADFILSLCELVVGGKEGLLPVEKTVIDRCVHLIYRKYFADPCPENMPILEDLYNALLQQDEKEAHHVATALEIYVKGSLNLFNHRTNVNVNNRIYQAAQAIHGVNDSHEWISNICDRLDESQETIIREIFKYASSYELFLSYIDNIKMWLSQHQNI